MQVFCVCYQEIRRESGSADERCKCKGANVVRKAKAFWLQNKMHTKQDRYDMDYNFKLQHKHYKL